MFSKQRNKTNPNGSVGIIGVGRKLNLPRMLTPDISDHCPLLICIEESRRNIKTPFASFHIWCDHPEFMDIMENVWSRPKLSAL